MKRAICIARVVSLGRWDHEGGDCVGECSNTLLPVALRAAENTD